MIKLCLAVRLCFFILALPFVACWSLFSDISSSSTSQAGSPLSNAISADNTTTWITADGQGPQKAVILDVGRVQKLRGVAYLPRQDGVANGRIGQYTLEISQDRAQWSTVGSGTFYDDPSLKAAGFTSADARYVRITTLSEAGGRGTMVSAAQFMYFVDNALQPHTTGRWEPVIPFPIIPVAVFLDVVSNKLMAFSSASRNAIILGGNVHGWTYGATYNPSTNLIESSGIINSNHDMFCPGMSVDFNGDVVVTGGDSTSNVTSWNPTTQQWEVGADMTIGRGYQSQATTSDGDLFIIGGSWANRAVAVKNGEEYSQQAAKWVALPGAQAGPMLTVDAYTADAADNHAWLFAWKQGYVLQAGPSSNMNWYGTNGSGSVVSAGKRAQDTTSMCGTAVMYDAVAGKVLTVGGSLTYNKSPASNALHLLQLGDPNTQVTVTTLSPMKNARTFANAVVLPNGQVFIVGGQSRGAQFTDYATVWEPELWDPQTQTTTVLPAMDIPRNYHGVAILLPDARVFTGGGGLCGNCGFNHEDGQIYSPAYLFDSTGALAKRPVISPLSGAATTVKLGSTLQVTVTGDNPISSFALIRYSSTTHAINTDQRRIPLTASSAGSNVYSMVIPSEFGIVIQGYWMLFAIDSEGVPSESIKILLRGE